MKKLKELLQKSQKKDAMIKSTLFFNEDDFKKLKIIAVKKERSVSAILRQLIKNYLAENK